MDGGCRGELSFGVVDFPNGTESFCIRIVRTIFCRVILGHFKGIRFQNLLDVGD